MPLDRGFYSEPCTLVNDPHHGSINYRITYLLFLIYSMVKEKLLTKKISIKLILSIKYISVYSVLLHITQSYCYRLNCWMYNGQLYP